MEPIPATARLLVPNMNQLGGEVPHLDKDQPAFLFSFHLFNLVIFYLKKSFKGKRVFQTVWIFRSSVRALPVTQVLFWNIFVVRPIHEVRQYLPSTKFLCKTLAGGEVSTLNRSNRVGRTTRTVVPMKLHKLSSNFSTKRPSAPLSITRKDISSR
jgi:hypothetical protein